MKTILIAATALLSIGGANAAVIDPMGYAQDYCALRRSGRSFGAASEAAVSRNLDTSRQAYVLDDGQDLDVVLSAEAVRLVCPAYYQ